MVYSYIYSYIWTYQSSTYLVNQTYVDDHDD